MKYIHYAIGLSLLFLVAIATGCKRETIYQPEEQTGKNNIDQVLDTKNMVPGEALIKLRPTTNSSTNELRSALGGELRSLTDEVTIEPIFEIGGAYETLQREAGLHLWYKVKFDQDADLSKTIKKLQEDERIEIATGNSTVKPEKVSLKPLSTLRAVGDTYNQGYPRFTNADPLLPHQWHYQNESNASDPYFVAGADINLFKAWDIETGKKDVVVAIIDSGIEGTHEDLQGSLWDNPEMPGTYGYNFVDNSYNIVPGFHGTHVAGTIAARNNNGIGVSGIAGGDGTPDSGVRLMSIQIFGRDKAYEGEKIKNAPIEDIARGFKWATEHGANIANCSWGFTDQNVNNDYPVLKDAIKYFVDNAGVDPNTKAQKAGAYMKGGLVIFASGNDGLKNDIIFPACYDFVVAVAAFGANMKATEYSNISDWVDITAPGGTLDLRGWKEASILSTISSTFANMPVEGTDKYGNYFLFNNNPGYALEQGTSMAAPHVTGVAALILSKFGGPGYTNDQLRERLLSSVKPVDFRAYNDRRYRDWLGSGYIDAARALEENNQKTPQMTTIEVKKVDYLSATISWLPAKDEDASDLLADHYVVTLSSEGEENIEKTIHNYGDKEGTPIEYTFKDLKDGTKYHVEIVAQDRWGNKSSKSVDFETLKNSAPAITNLPKEMPISLSKSLPFYNLSLTVKDEEGHKWKLKEAINQPGVKVTIKENSIDLLFLISNIELGEYSLPIVLEDELGKTSTTHFTYKVVSYERVKKVADFGMVTISRYAEPMQIELSDKYESPSGLKLSYAAKTSDSTIATVRILPGTTKLEITPKKVGSTMVQIIVSDGTKEYSSGFSVKVEGSSEAARAAGGTFILYPMPTEGVLSIQTGADTALPREVIITTLRGELVHRQYIDRDKEGISHVNLQKLTPGIYRMHLGKTVRTIIKK